MLRNTKIQIKEVPYSELIPGNTYLIHHNDERKRELKKNTYYTRFKGKFVKYFTIKSSTEYVAKAHLAVFENVEIFEDVENPIKKIDIPRTVYVLSEKKDHNIHGDNIDYYRIYHKYDESINGEYLKLMLDHIKTSETVGFDMDDWSFGETVQNQLLQKVYGRMANDGPDPNDSYEKQRYTKLRRDVFGTEFIGNTVGEYIRPQFKFPKATTEDLQRRRALVERNRSKSIPTGTDRQSIIEARRVDREERDRARKVVANSKTDIDTSISDKEQKKILKAEQKALKDYERAEKTRRKKEEKKGGRTRRNLRNK